MSQYEVLQHTLRPQHAESYTELSKSSTNQRTLNDVTLRGNTHKVQGVHKVCSQIIGVSEQGLILDFCFNVL